MTDLNIELVKIALATAGGVWTLMTYMDSVRQRKREFRWKQSEEARKALDEMVSNHEIKSALNMLDWGIATYRTHKGEMDISFEDRDWAMRRADKNGFDVKCQFVRICFDRLFEKFDMLENLVRIGYLNFEDFAAPLRFYVENIKGNTNMVQFAADYKYHLALKFFDRFNSIP